MIQDIESDYLLDYKEFIPEAGDYILSYGIGKIKLENNQIIRYNGKYPEKLTYGFTIGNKKYFLDLTEHSNGYDIQIFRSYPNKDDSFAMITGYHLFTWYNKHKYCGCCGKKMIEDSKMRKLTCSCGNEVFPVIAPAVIVGVIHKDKILMTKYRVGYKEYALVAGFTEIGEAFEDTVRREVFEEVGLHVDNIRYYKSQPWGLSGCVLSGYYADAIDDDDTPTLELDELKEATWFSKNEITLPDDNVSLTREMILNFKNNM